MAELCGQHVFSATGLVARLNKGSTTLVRFHSTSCARCERSMRCDVCGMSPFAFGRWHSPSTLPSKRSDDSPGRDGVPLQRHVAARWHSGRDGICPGRSLTIDCHSPPMYPMPPANLRATDAMGRIETESRCGPRRLNAFHLPTRLSLALPVLEGRTAIKAAARPTPSCRPAER